ncbi:hypothetical protein SBOR_9754 [Sclerotinia borealis F-4128]|uniref:RRM domain-containing protein n=1 Tax=Sclerotinia borealis (strain F-4128) TaxID=1432307 RepID=W9C2E7_SCLBF|nr:hypothetical protein SBOR_9754 [Sclerotinia borealis F-4128]
MANPSMASYTSHFDAQMNPREVFLLDVQERFAKVMENNRQREAERVHQSNFNLQIPYLHAQYWESQQNQYSKDSNFTSIPQQNMTSQTTYANTPVHGAYMARHPVPVRRATGHMQMPSNSRNFEAAAPNEIPNPFGYGHGQVGNQMWNRGTSATNQHQQEPRRLSPPPNYFTRSVTFTESYSTNPVNNSQNNEMHHQNRSQGHVSHEHSTMGQHTNMPQDHVHVPHTVTEMNEELNMPKEAVPFADQFQMEPSKRLLRRNGSLIPGEEPSPHPSSNYKGNPAAGLIGLPHHLNCALWLTNLPPDIQPFEVFEEINTGAVSAFEITRPQGIFVMSAAKLIFKHPEAAARFISQSEGPTGIIVRRRRIKVRYNMFGHRRYRKDERTRVLAIEGPVEHIEYEDLKLYFESFCDHELSGWEYVPSSIPGYRKLVWGFARIDGQATQCLNGIRSHPVWGKVLTVDYAPDPCGRFYP